MPTSTEGEISLETWLRQRSEYTLVLGASGHLLLSEAESAAAAAQLTQRVLPEIAARHRGSSVLLATGAAPGADQVFSLTAQRWFERAGIRCASVALLPVPAAWLLRDWALRAAAAGLAVTPAQRRRCGRAIAQTLAQARWRVPLYDAAAADRQRLAASADWRTEQYRRLAACLAEQSDVLVAVLSAQRSGEPGGTAEVVDWRRHPQRIPPPLSTRAPGAGPGARRPLIVIDPGLDSAAAAAEAAPGTASETVMITEPAGDGAAPTGDAAAQPIAVAAFADTISTEQETAAVLAAAEAAMRDGNDLRCHDLLARAYKRGLGSRRMDYLRILTLANIGGTRLALDHYRALVLAPDELSEDWLALHGRLEKDLALAGGAGARAHFLRAAAAYADSFRRWHGPYSGINAATMNLMAGRKAQARRLAQAVLARLQMRQPDSDLARFFHCATAAEAALHVGDLALCRQQLAQANAHCVNDVVRRGRTLQQLGRVCRLRAIDPDLLDALRMPLLLLLRRRPDNGPPPESAAHELHIECEMPAGSLLFMPLLDRVDLDVAEAALQRGVHLYPTLAQAAAEAAASWGSRWGEAAAQRLGRVLERAQRIAIVPGFLDTEAQWSAHELAGAALGASLQTAMRLGCEWRPCWVQRLGAHVYCRPGHPSEYLAPPPTPPNRRMVGMLFADFAGYGRIPDADMPRFWREIMGTMSTRLAHYGERVLFSATWGDALHVITTSASAAAEIAADILQSLDERRATGGGGLSRLELRVAAHYAPAFEDVDTLRGNRVFYGSQISFAARIEPVTPTGTVFGSDAFVARLTLEAPERYNAEYAGELELAKKFGAHPLFAVQRRARH